MAAADARFHDLIFEIGANPVLAGMYRPMRDMMVESQRLPMTLKTRLGETLDEHRRLFARLAGAGFGGRRGRHAGSYPGGGAALRHRHRLSPIAVSGVTSHRTSSGNACREAAKMAVPTGSKA